MRGLPPLGRDVAPAAGSRELRVDTDGAILAATYSPAGDTAIVALHGASDGTREGVLYQHLHRILPTVGIGAVTFDRRGEGKSTGDASRGRFELQAADALAVLEATGVERAGLWGYSQGAWAALLAGVASQRVAFLVLVASTGVTPAEQMRYATASQLRLAGYDDEVGARALERRMRFEDWVHGRGREREDELGEDLAAALDEPWSGHLFLPAALPGEEARARWIEEMDFDPRPVLARVSIPTLAFYGELDSWTPVEPSVAAWRGARGADVETIVVPGAEHDLTLPSGELSSGYERRLIEWLAGRCGSVAVR